MRQLDYRERTYQYYVKARQRSLAPENIQGLMPRAPMLRKIINKHFPADRSASILDLGCGHGAFVYFVQEAGYVNAKGVDRSPEQVSEARRLGIEGVKQGDLLETLQSLPGSSQAVVIAFDVIEHFTKKELTVFIDEVLRVLKSDGKWIIHAPNGESPFASRIRYGDYTHETAFTRVSLEQILKSSGFLEVSCQEDAAIPHGLKSAIRWILWKGIRGVLRLYLMAETGAGERESIFSQSFLTVAIK